MTLRDGTQVAIRPIRPDDAPRLQALHQRLSPQSRALRFLSIRSELPQDEAIRLATVDYQSRMAFVATCAEKGEERIIGVARYAAQGPASPHEAEAAIVVEDKYQGRGLGTRLLEILIDYARAHSIKTFVAEISVENSQMMRLIHQSGIPTETKLERGVWEVRLKLDAAPPAASQA